MKSYTPGPWKLRQNGYHDFSLESDDKRIGRIWASPANAHLMRASPALAEILRRLVELKPTAGGDPIVVQAGELLRKADLLLAEIEAFR